MPKISVVLTTYNRAHLLPKAIDSVLQQSFTDLELIVVDNGSTDHTRDVVAQFSDARLVYVYLTENQGVTGALNAGVEKCTGDYFCTLCDDNWYLPNGLTCLVAALEQQPEIGLAAGGYVLVDEAGQTLREVHPWVEQPSLELKILLFGSFTDLESCLIRRRWMQRVGGFDPQFRICADFDFFFQLMAVDCPMAWVKELIFCYRLHPSQTSRTLAPSHAGTEHLAVLDKFFNRPDLPSELRAIKQAAYALYYLWSAVRTYEEEQISEAQAELERALQLDAQLVEQRLLEVLTNVALHPLKGNRPVPFAYLQTVFDNLPESAAGLRRRRREAMAQVAMTQLFQAQRTGDWSTIRRMFWMAAYNQPAWLRNRGVWSIAATAFLGPAAMQRLRSYYRAMRTLRVSKREQRQIT